MAARKSKRAGGQKRMGRPAAPPQTLRRNRVVVMMTDTEVEKLHRLAANKEIAVGTAAYEILARALKRRK